MAADARSLRQRGARRLFRSSGAGFAAAGRLAAVAAPGSVLARRKSQRKVSDEFLPIQTRLFFSIIRECRFSAEFLSS